MKDEENEFEHFSNTAQTPLRANAFELRDEDKIERITKSVRDILETLGMDLTDDSLKGTPKRVAKAYVNELFSGLNPLNKPSSSTFENKYQYGEMLVEKNITLYSTCEHHLLPIVGKAHVAYVSSGRVVGLSKMNRIVEYYANRPQVQERLTVQIGKEIARALNTEDVGVVVDANHMCVASRGVGDTNSKTGTAYFSGKFKDENVKREFLNYINSK